MSFRCQVGHCRCFVPLPRWAAVPWLLEVLPRVGTARGRAPVRVQARQSCSRTESVLSKTPAVNGRKDEKRSVGSRGILSHACSIVRLPGEGTVAVLGASNVAYWPEYVH
jgi:hypothetical protein